MCIIQVTTVCNMRCAHCCLSCSAEIQGEHMAYETYRKAISFCEQYSGAITISGGEPTIHPQFWQFFGEACGADVEYVWMATNGKKTRTALALAGLASGSEKFGVALSQDVFHDPIDPRVVEAFKHHGLEIRDVSDNVLSKGFAIDNGVGVDDGCACSEIFIKPDGEIRMCGCDDSLVLGHLDDIDDEVLSRAIEMLSELGCGDDLDLSYCFLTAVRGAQYCVI